MGQSLQHRLAAAKSGDDVDGLLAREAQGSLSNRGAEAGAGECRKLLASPLAVGVTNPEAAQAPATQVDQGGRQLVGDLLGDGLGGEAGINAARQKMALHCPARAAASGKAAGALSGKSHIVEGACRL